MSPAQRAYLIGQCGVGAAIGNALLNGGIGWLITLGLVEFPVWKLPGVAFDLAATVFGVAFGTRLGAVLQVRWDIAKGKITPPEVGPAMTRFLAHFQGPALGRGVMLGALALPVFLPPVFAVLAGSGAPALARSTFIWLKAGLSAVEGGLVTPFIVLAVLRDHANRAARAAVPTA